MAAASRIIGVPSYNQNGLKSTSWSSLASSACGPTAAANMLAYWDQRTDGYPHLWEPDSDFAPFPGDDSCWQDTCSIGAPLIAHLYGEMGTSSDTGTSPYAWVDGVYDHVYNVAGTCSTGQDYAVSIGLYQKADSIEDAPELVVNDGGVTADEMWAVIRAEIDKQRPVALYIDLLDRFSDPNRRSVVTSTTYAVSPSKYKAGLLTSETRSTYQLYAAYRYHWVTVYGYEGSAVGSRILHIKSGFGMNHQIRFDSYYDNADNVALVTLTPQRVT